MKFHGGKLIYSQTRMASCAQYNTNTLFAPSEIHKMNSDELRTTKRPLSAAEKPAALTCAVVAIDHGNFCYRVCSVCEKVLLESPTSACRHCSFTKPFNPATSSSKRLYRVLMSIATDTKVFPVIMFDRAARVLFGCSADEFFDFAMTRPCAAMRAGRALEGEMLSVTLSKPKNGNAQHVRVVSVVPLCSGFQPVIETLRETYRVRGGGGGGTSLYGPLSW